MLSRRDLVGKLAVGAAGVVALAASGTRARAAIKGPQRMPDSMPEENPETVEKPREEATGTTEAAAPPAPPPPWELLAPLTAGAAVAYGWHVADLSGPEGGACVLALENQRGRMARIHLCRNDGQPQGLVYTQKFDLVVMNGGRGDLGTEENLAQAVAAVAHIVAANEDRASHAETLLPHAERLRLFAAANEWTLR